ncbi:MAG TPA: hypothetical protein VF552_12855 [Allosphingosinicella sp.]|jgi:hypothetical protein
MLGELLAVGTLLGAGQLADQLGTKRLRLVVLSFIRSSRGLDWHKFVALKAWAAYVIIYGSKSSSLRFQIRSSVIYLFLFAASLAFLRVFFPVQFASVTSVFYYGGTAEVIGWLVAAALGMMLYVLANAQTLYFLEVLKTAPSTFKFFLVAYADFLITSSVALFGVPATMLIASAISVSNSESEVDVTFQFERLVRSPSIDILRQYGGSIDSARVEELIRRQEELFYFEVDFTVRPRSLDEAHRDFDLTRVSISSGDVENATYDGRTQTIRVLDESGSVLGYRERDYIYRDRVATIEFLEGTTTLEQRRRQFCSEFSSAREPDHPQVAYTLTGEQASRLREACTNEGEVSLAIPVRYNSSNVDYGGTYFFFLSTNLADLLRSLGNGFGSYLALSPYSMLAPQRDRGGWWHTHRLGEQQANSSVAMDNALSSALYADRGGYNQFLNRSVAAGTINFAIMSTAAFNVAVMSFLFVFYPLVALARRSRLLARYAGLRKYPFTILAIVASLYALALRALL